MAFSVQLNASAKHKRITRMLRDTDTDLQPFEASQEVNVCLVNIPDLSFAPMILMMWMLMCLGQKRCGFKNRAGKSDDKGGHSSLDTAFSQ